MKKIKFLLLLLLITICFINMKNVNAKDGPNILKSFGLQTQTSNYEIGDKMTFIVDATKKISSMSVFFYNPVSINGHDYGNFVVSLTGDCYNNNEGVSCTFEGTIPDKIDGYSGTNENGLIEMSIYPGMYEVSSIFIYDENNNLIRYTTNEEYANDSDFLYYPNKIGINIVGEIQKDGPDILKTIALQTQTSNYEIGEKMTFIVDATEEIKSMIITFYNPVSIDGHYYGNFAVHLTGNCYNHNNGATCTFEGIIPKKIDGYYGTNENGLTEMSIYPGTYEVSSIFIYDKNNKLIRYTTSEEYANNSEFLHYDLKIKVNIKKPLTVYYNTHVQTYGWQDYVSNGEISGTIGEAKRLEGIRIGIENQEYPGNILYRTHIQSYGWEKSFKKNFEMSGTSGEAKRLEAIEIKLDGELSEHFDVYYRVHAQTYGWLGWAKNGEKAGTAGLAKRLEAIQILLVKKSVPFEEYGNEESFKEKKIEYTTHVQTYGWQDYTYDGNMSGTSGEAKRLEGIKIRLNNQEYMGGVAYRTHIQSFGWETTYSRNGEMSGTSGLAKRLEAIEIKLTGEIANHYDIYYRVHAQTYGWLAWAKNGERAGTSGLAKRLEGIEIILVKKGKLPPKRDNQNNEQAYIAPAEPDIPYVEPTEPDIPYIEPEEPIQQDDWTEFVTDIKNGNYDKYPIGYTKTVNMGTLGTHTLRVANNTTPDECRNSGFSQTACGFVLEFADIITNYQMNNANANNIGGWSTSKMRTYVNNEIYNLLPTSLKNAIIDTTVVSGHGGNDTNNFITTDKLYLLSPREVWKDIDGNTSKGIDYHDKAYESTRQLDYYEDLKTTIGEWNSSLGTNNGNYSASIKKLNYKKTHWWLRSAYDTSYFFTSDYNEGWNAEYSNAGLGVSPAFRIRTEEAASIEAWKELVNDVKKGNTSKYPVGYTKTVDMGNFGIHTLRVVNNSTPADCSTTGFSQTACGFVLEFADIISKYKMNETSTNAGGWAESKIRTYINSEIYNALPDIIKNSIKDTYVVSTNGLTSGETNITSTDKLYLISKRELGLEDDLNEPKEKTRPLDYYINRITTLNIKKYNNMSSDWWLRSTFNSVTNNSFYNVTNSGTIYVETANNEIGVSPAFRLG